MTANLPSWLLIKCTINTPTLGALQTVQAYWRCTTQINHTAAIARTEGGKQRGMSACVRGRKFCRELSLRRSRRGHYRAKMSSMLLGITVQRPFVNLPHANLLTAHDVRSRSKCCKFCRIPFIWQDRFHDVSSYRKGRCRREQNEYRDFGPGMYDGPSMMELQQTRPKTMGR